MVCFFQVEKMGSPSHNQLKIFFLNSLFIHFLLQDFSQIHYLLHKVTMNSLSISQIHYDFTMVRASIMNRLSFSRFHLLFFEFTINSFFFANPLWIHYLFCEYTMNSLFISRIYYWFVAYWRVSRLFSFIEFIFSLLQVNWFK